jgi:hypothetical protein
MKSSDQALAATQEPCLGAAVVNVHGSRRNARVGAGHALLGQRRHHLKEECWVFPHSFPAAAALPTTDPFSGLRRNARAIAGHPPLPLHTT